MPTSIKLTSELESKILASIRAGGFVWVAAKAWGVSIRLCKCWLKKGRKKKARDPYRSFAMKVDQAQGQARLKAETDLFKDDAQRWLQHGPGKETPGRPGWSGLAKPAVTAKSGKDSLFDDPQLLRLLNGVRGVLAPYQDAQSQLDQMMDAQQ